MSASSSTARSPASPCTSAPASPAQAGLGRCSSRDGQGPRRRLGHRVRRARRGRAERRTGGMEALCRCRFLRRATRRAVTSPSPTRCRARGRSTSFCAGLYLERRARMGGAGPRRVVPGAGEFCRLIVFDKRGTGLSDRVTGSQTWRRGWTMLAPSWGPRVQAGRDARVFGGELVRSAVRDHVSRAGGRPHPLRLVLRVRLDGRRDAFRTA